MFSFAPQYRRTTWLSIAVALAVVAILGLSAVPSSAATQEVRSAKELTDAIARSADGDVIVVHGGDYGALTVRNRLWQSPVRIVPAAGESVVFQTLSLAQVTNVIFDGIRVAGKSTIAGGSGVGLINSTLADTLVTNGASNVFIANNVIRPTNNGGIGVQVNVGAHDVVILGNTITGGWRNIHLYGAFQVASKWISNIMVVGNDLAGAGGDNIQITGARHVLIQDNFIHDPRQTSDHNDGVQSTASDDLQIVGNMFTAPGAIDNDQAIILSHASQDNPNMRVTNSVVRDNVIHNWRGSGIAIAGAINTVLENNTSYDNGDSATGKVSAGLLIGTLRGQYDNPNLQVSHNVFSNIRYQAGALPASLEDYNCVATGGAGPHDVTSDPRFVDRITYRTASDGPCAANGSTRSFDVRGVHPQG